jgi:hypothetical protein
MSDNAKDLIKVIAFAAVVGVLFVLIARVPWPKCKPGDPGVVIGGMLVGGCPPLIYRNDGSVTPP